MKVSTTPAPLLESVVLPQALPPDLCELVNKLLAKSAKQLKRPSLRLMNWKMYFSRLKQTALPLVGKKEVAKAVLTLDLAVLQLKTTTTVI